MTYKALKIWCSSLFVIRFFREYEIRGIIGVLRQKKLKFDSMYAEFSNVYCHL